MGIVLDGFWLPRSVRDEVLQSGTEYTTLSMCRGRVCAPSDEGAVTVRWPKLRAEQWDRLLAALRQNRGDVPRGTAYWARFHAALQAVAQKLSNPMEESHAYAVPALAGFTGYSEPMVRLVFDGLDLMSFEEFPAAFRLAEFARDTPGWQPMPGLPGRLRYYATESWRRAAGRLFGNGDRHLFGPHTPPQLAIGYGAGNVPGTALFISMLVQSTALTGETPPVILVKNSRREPIFTTLALQALEAIDETLLSTIAVLVWDYEEVELQEKLISQADLVIAAASDETISQIDAIVRRVSQRRWRYPDRGRPGARRRATAPSIRFHSHGHKVSFSAIGREMLSGGGGDSVDGHSLLDVVSLLSALDSALWDQNGCLSSRIHFVEAGEIAESNQVQSGCTTDQVLSYAQRLVEWLRLLAVHLPRGSWPLQQLHDRFDRYTLLESTGRVEVLSTYEDEFLVVVDSRPVGDAASWLSTINDCQGRVVIVRPVRELAEIPDLYLKLVPKRSLQSLSVAVGRPGQGLTPGFLRFAEQCGACGVTGIRTVGRAAFPQLAYSWDGLLPLDLVRTRPPGRFTTIEFDRPYEQIADTYRLLLRRGSVLGTTAA